MSLTTTDLTNFAQSTIFGSDPNRIYEKVCYDLDVHQTTHLLHVACYTGNEPLVRFILSRGGYDLLFRDEIQSLRMIEWAKTKEIRTLLSNFGFSDTTPIFHGSHHWDHSQTVPRKRSRL